MAIYNHIFRGVRKSNKAAIVVSTLVQKKRNSNITNWKTSNSRIVIASLNVNLPKWDFTHLLSSHTNAE